jgi:hypothetical protein
MRGLDSSGASLYHQAKSSGRTGEFFSEALKPWKRTDTQK